MNRPRLALLAPILLAVAPARADDPPPSLVRFERTVIDADLADAYQVEVADVDGDRRPDVVALGNNAIAWYQNPTWAKRVIATTRGGPLVADIISSATADLDGDGRAEVAIACDFAMNTPARGQLFLASQGATLGDPWTIRKVADVPSIHRLRWADLEGDRKLKLIVAPIFGPKSRPPAYDQDLARVVELTPAPGEPRTPGPWAEREILRRPVVHAVGVAPNRFRQAPGRQPAWILTADNTGLSLAVTHREPDGRNFAWEAAAGPLVPGAEGPAPRRGCSDFRAVDLPGGPMNFVTIEPWHGSTLAFWRLGGAAPGGDPGMMSPDAGYVRTVIDDTLDDGHALWVADVDGDRVDEVFAGHRGKDHRVAMYRLEKGKWARTILDTAIAAQDLRGGDLDGDGLPDVVAVGGKTHNVVLYHPIRPAAGR